MEFPSVFKTHVGLLYNSHIPPLSVGLETESSSQDDTGHNYMQPIRIRANRSKTIRKIKSEGPNLISKCHKGAQLYSKISKNYE